MSITLKQLAGHLGLSQTTVSRALNGYPEVSEATRARVAAAAAELGYAPNPRARGLATGRAMAIGHVLPMPREAEVLSPVFADFLAGAGEVYTGRGYGVHIAFVGFDEEAACYERLLTQRIVDGVVLHAPRTGDPRPAVLSALGLPFAVHGRMEGDTDGYTWVDTDNAAAGRMAAEHLIGLGHRRIALLNGLPTLTFARERLRGYAEALEAAGISIDPSLVSHAVMTEGYGHDRTVELLAQDAPPTALIAGSMMVGNGARRAAAETRRILGRDLSLVVHDDVLSYLPNDGDPPGLTATQSPVAEAGALLATALIDRIETQTLPPAQVVLPPLLIPGLSSGPLNPTTP